MLEFCSALHTGLVFVLTGFCEYTIIQKAISKKYSKNRKNLKITFIGSAIGCIFHFLISSLTIKFDNWIDIMSTSVKITWSVLARYTSIT